MRSRSGSRMFSRRWRVHSTGAPARSAGATSGRSPSRTSRRMASAWTSPVSSTAPCTRSSCSVETARPTGAQHAAARWSMRTRLRSSFICQSWERSPASMCTTGMRSSVAASAPARDASVSPMMSAARGCSVERCCCTAWSAAPSEKGATSTGSVRQRSVTADGSTSVDISGSVCWVTARTRRSTPVARAASARGHAWTTSGRVPTTRASGASGVGFTGSAQRGRSGGVEAVDAVEDVGRVVVRVREPEASLSATVVSDRMATM